MESRKQIDCFKMNMIFWKITGTWPGDPISKYYKYYSITFLVFFYYLYFTLPTINFIFLPKVMDVIIEETLFYFTEINVVTKVLTFVYQRDKIYNILGTLESTILQPQNEKGKKIVARAKRYIILYWKIIAVFSVVSNGSHILSPFVIHLIFGVPLELPLCSYDFVPDEFKEKFIYPIYIYQCIGMHFHMWINVNTDTFLLGLMMLVIAQLEILDDKLRNITTKSISTGKNISSATSPETVDGEIIKNLNQSIMHFDAVAKFCDEVQEVFSVSLFIQFGIASCLLCVCLFRFTLPAPMPYYIFLTTYIFIMTVQILVPCWFGTQLTDKCYGGDKAGQQIQYNPYKRGANLSFHLSEAIYDCDWTPRSKQFKSSLRILVARLNNPLVIIGGKIFPLTLTSFTSIMNSAYSFFTLLRHMQLRESTAND